MAGLGRCVQRVIGKGYILDGYGVYGPAIHHSDSRQVSNLDGGSAATARARGDGARCRCDTTAAWCQGSRTADVKGRARADEVDKGHLTGSCGDDFLSRYCE